MCTEMEAEWSFSSGPPTAAGPDYRAVNAAVLQLLLEKFAGSVARDRVWCCRRDCVCVCVCACRVVQSERAAQSLQKEGG